MIMNEKNKKNTVACLAAINEESISPLQLLQEIQPLLKEYFIGNFKIENNAIKMRFLNGDKFNLTIGKVIQ